MNNKCILIIDDERDIREIARISLEMTKAWTVIVADSGQEGLVMATQKQPDAILLDVMMPDMDGPTTLKRLKQNPDTQDIPVLLLTASAKVAEQRQYLLLGAKAVLIKPFDPEFLATQIETALAWSH